MFLSVQKPHRKNTKHRCRRRIGYKGLFTEDGVTKLPISDWDEGENPFRDIAAGLAKFMENGIFGKRALVISPKLYLKLQRIQPGTGITEYDRINTLLGGNIFKTPVLKNDQAILVYPEPQNMDLVIEQDMITSYLETKKPEPLFPHSRNDSLKNQEQRRRHCI